MPSGSPWKLSTKREGNERKDPVLKLLILFIPESKKVSSEMTRYNTVLCVSKAMHIDVYRLEVLLRLGKVNRLWVQIESHNL